MSAPKIIGVSLQNIPWQDSRSSDLVWRYDHNPIIPRDGTPTSNSIFNSAVVPFQNGFAGVFRVDNKQREMRLHAGFSENGINWKINPNPIEWNTDKPIPDYGYDPRVTKIDDRFLVTFCAGYHGPTIGLAETQDFKTFVLHENATLPYNRNGVLFPRKINQKYLLLTRPSDRGHTPFGDIFLSKSSDLKFWGEHRFVMSPEQPWESTKIGAGPVPIETSEGWLLFYHGVLTSCNGFVYHFGAALLDLDHPEKLIGRTKSYLLSPTELYERTGDVPNVVFPCAALSCSETGKIAIYYGAGDTVTALAFCKVDQVVDAILSRY